MRIKECLWVYTLMMGLVLICSIGCDKDEISDSKGVATITTADVIYVTNSTAVSGGSITDDGGQLVTARGVCWSTGKAPTINDNKTEDGTGAGSFRSDIIELDESTTYHVRAYAISIKGVNYGNTYSFKTPKKLYVPTVTTREVNEITHRTANSGGNVTDDGGTTIYAGGVCWSTNELPTIFDNKTEESWDDLSKGEFSTHLIGLTPDTKYYVRAYATNGVGTSYGEIYNFITLDSTVETEIQGDDVFDIDGNRYKTIIVGKQQWMAENLKTTKYNDNTPIPFVENGSEWGSLTKGRYCWYNNNEANKAIYGALYNWHTVNTDKLCPKGWHVPSAEEWITLQIYLGGRDIAGGKLKATGTEHWFRPNAEATNIVGFNGLPGGARDYQGKFLDMGYFGHWQTTTSYSDNTHRDVGLRYEYGNLLMAGTFIQSVSWGMSVRCIRD